LRFHSISIAKISQKLSQNRLKIDKYTFKCIIIFDSKNIKIYGESLAPHNEATFTLGTSPDSIGHEGDPAGMQYEMVSDLFEDTESAATKELQAELVVEETDIVLHGLELAVELPPVTAADVVDPDLMTADLRHDTNVSVGPSIAPSEDYFHADVSESRENVSDTQGQF
jgi:hypothetical protein